MNLPASHKNLQNFPNFHLAQPIKLLWSMTSEESEADGELQSSLV